MRQSPENFRFSSTDKFKQLFFEMEDSQIPGIKHSPFFYAEVRIDFSDVRTGFKSTISLNKAISIYLITPDLLWAEDMIHDIDPEKVKSFPPDPAFIGSLPDFIDVSFMSQVETQFIHYLLRTYKTKVYRNSELNTYSNAGESLAEFATRCLDLLDEPKRRELDVLHEVFVRRLEQIKQKYLISNTSENLELAKVESRDRDLFWNYSDRITDLFLKSKLRLNATKNDFHLTGKNSDLEERLTSLELEAKKAIAAIQDSYRDKAQSNDEYILHPNLKDIHFVRCCILWIPARAA